MTRAPARAPETATETMIIGRFTSGPDYLTDRPHGAHRALIMLTLSGAGRVTLSDDAPFVARRDTLAYLPANAPHRYGTDPLAGTWKFWWAHYRPRPGWPTPTAGLTGLAEDVVMEADRRFADLHAAARWPGHGPVPARRPTSEDAATSQEISHLTAPLAPNDTAGGTAGQAGDDRASDNRNTDDRADAVRADDGRADVSTADEVLATAPAGWRLAAPLLEALLVLVTQDSTNSTVRDPRVARALALVAADPAAGHTLTTLAGAVALSPSRLAHLATTELGEPLMHRVRTVRLAHAARLLAETPLTVAQVAHASGFASPFHFSRAFRAAYGHPPSHSR